MTTLEVHDLVKQLGTDPQAPPAVDGVSLTVREDELLVLLGPSGCGKTTTLRMICGLETPDSGRIVVAGRELGGLPIRDRNLGMVFQEYGLYPTMTVFGNIAYGLETRGGLSKPEIDQRVREAAARLDLSDLLAGPIGTLSGGEQQRVALARAMVKDADAYLFDEPLSNLDPKLRYRARRDIAALHRLKGKPSLYVTHDQDEAFALADQIAVMSEGRIQQVGPPADLIDNPANTFVAGFVGSPPMNLLEATIRTADGAPHLLAGGDAVLPCPPGYSSGEVVVGIRPDALELTTHPDEAGVIHAQVTQVENLLGETLVRARTADKSYVTAQLREDSRTQGLREGEHITLSVDGVRIRLFDPTTTLALPTPDLSGARG